MVKEAGIGASEWEYTVSILPDMGLPNTMSEAEYAALPEELASQIEVVHGYVIVCESPTPQHQQVARGSRIGKHVEPH